MSKLKWPNFLIIGAAKAGTTALYHQLNSHPEIFMSAQKEMNYFDIKDHEINFTGPGDMDGIHRTTITKKEEYLSFFSARMGLDVSIMSVPSLFFTLKPVYIGLICRLLIVSLEPKKVMMSLILN